MPLLSAEENQTFAQVTGKESIDWKARLEAALEHYPLEAERDKMFYASAAWETCLCGQLSAKIPRRHSGAPVDRRLAFFGSEFVSLIGAEKYRTALELIEKVDARVAILASYPDFTEPL